MVTPRKPRAVHQTSATIAETHQTFADFIASLGMSYADEHVELAMQQLVFEGMPFGNRPAQLRRPDSKFYDKTYLEARAVARALVEIGVHTGVLSVRRSRAPQPDVTVEYADHVLYVEHAMIVDESAIAVDVAIEDANFLLHDATTSDAQLAGVFDRGILTVRLTTVDVAVGIDVRALAVETASVARSLAGDVSLFVPAPELYPTLTSNGARFFYKTCPTPSVMPIQTDDTLDRLREFEPTLRRVLEQKIAAVERYDAECKPVWLLLSVGHGFELMPCLPETVEQVVAELGIGGFDRLGVQIPRRYILLFEPPPWGIPV